jgi:DNA mismatch endonuclease (patch repair protein)
MDRMTREDRRALMARIKAKGTAPEAAVLAILRSLRFRPHLHVDSLPGTPDLVLPRRRAVVLVHGCFWHRHRGCKRAFVPASRAAFWAEKFVTNVRRDRRVARALRALGWRVVTVWECEVAPGRVARLRRRLVRLLGS